MSRVLSSTVGRQLSAVVAKRMATSPVVVLAGARAVGKSVLLRELAEQFKVTVVDIDDLDTRAAVTRDPSLFASGPGPILIDEFQHVPLLLDAIKAELNRSTTFGRYVITGSTRYDMLPRSAQSLTGRASVVPVWPLSQGELDGHCESFLPTLLADGTAALGPVPATSRDEYIDRIIGGGLPMPLMLPVEARDRWFADYVALICERDVVALSKVRQRDQLPRLLTRLSSQTAQVLNIADAARSVGIEASSAENYTQLLESVFLVHRLPAWGTTVGSKAGAAPKLHVLDSGLAAHLLRLTREKLAQRSPQALTEFGQLVETFVVGELLKQASWLERPVTTGHWRTRGGDEVDLVLERTDGAVLGFEVKAASRVRPGDGAGLVTLARRLGDQWLGGVVLYLGAHTTPLDPIHHITATPVAALWSS